MHPKIAGIFPSIISQNTLQYDYANIIYNDTTYDDTNKP
ncbi:MAG: hypothetical protein KatS3mg113_0274 [Planctomycetaceae bacterium]|nr:MAG: hypothetical protein KatS3mg113_0274 [Planctomycetaceae bacterium]